MCERESCACIFPESVYVHAIILKRNANCLTYDIPELLRLNLVVLVEHLDCLVRLTRSPGV